MKRSSPLDLLFRETFDFLPRFGYEFVRPEQWFNAAAVSASQFLAVMYEGRDGLTLVFLGLLSRGQIPAYTDSADIFDIDDVREAMGATAPSSVQRGPQHSQSVLVEAAAFLRKQGVPKLEGSLLEELRALIRSRVATRWDL